MLVRSDNLKEIVKGKQQGIVLPMVLIIMLSLSILGLSLLVVWDFASRNTLFEKNQLKAYYIARAGSEATARYIISNSDELAMKNYVDQLIAAGESSAVSLGDGYFRVHLTRDSLHHLIKIVSIGSVGNVSATSTITLNEMTSSAPTLDKSIYSLGKLKMTGSSAIYGDVGTNSVVAGGVTLNGNPRIDGDVFIGQGGDPETVVSTPKHSSGLISGTITPQTANRTYTLPAFPDFPSDLPDMGSFTAGWWPSPPYYIVDDGQYTDLTVKSDLIIDVGSGKRYIRVKNLSIIGDGKITLTGSGTLYLYVDNSFDLNGSSSINYDNGNGDPTKVIMFYKGSDTIKLAGATYFYGNIYTESSDVDLAGSGNLNGNVISGGSEIDITGDSSAIVQAIYAPNAEVNLTGSGKVTGAIVAKNINMFGDVRVYYSSAVNSIFSSLWQSVGNDDTVTYTMGLRS